jgi:hypothetical protein
VRQLLVLLLLVVAAPAARAEVRLEVAGSTELSGDTLDVRVDVTNRGTTAAVPVAVEGELFGHRDQAKLEQGIEPGASRSVLLRYPLGEQQPGLHPLLLLLDYGPPGTSQSASQRAFLLLALGSAATGAVQLQVPEVEIAFLGPVTVRLTSTDGAPHRVRLSLATPRHLRADPQPVDVEVPAQGEARARLRVFRGAAPRGAPQGVLVVASTLDEPVVRTTVATSIVRVRAEVSWMARLRVPLISIAVLLLLGSVWRELA